MNYDSPILYDSPNLYDQPTVGEGFSFNGAGLTLLQKLAVAAALKCGPCCEGGSGSGSGSGGGGRVRSDCCAGQCSVVTNLEISYELPGCGACAEGCASGTGTDTGEACSAFGGEYYEEGTVDVLGYVRVFKECGDILTKRVRVEAALCCGEKDDGSFYFTFAAIVDIAGPGGSIQWNYKSPEFDVASCAPFIFSVIELQPFQTFTAGTPPCTCDNPALSLVVTGDCA